MPWRCAATSNSTQSKRKKHTSETVTNRVTQIEAAWRGSYDKHSADFARQIAEAGEKDLAAISDRRDELRRKQSTG